MSAQTGVGDVYTPSASRPLVYHLFGHLSVPDSLVLTEDNYFDYLIGVSRKGKENPIPTYVRAALARSALLFVGFKIDDWDFRVFFRSLRSQPSGFLRKKIKHVAVQIDPEADRFLDPERARRYLQKYFVGADIYVYWGSTEDFPGELRTRGEACRRGEQICAPHGSRSGSRHRSRPRAPRRRRRARTLTSARALTRRETAKW
jgi:hypothetical protein